MPAGSSTRLPKRLWTYILADLWRLLILTTAVIVAVIALAVTIRPLADGKLTPLQAIHFMGLATVPMLAYAVPFGAGFAATLVYHRMANDNETAAAHAGGIGHRSILAPALISGVLLAGTLGVISDQVIPRFLRTMESYVKLSIADWMVVQLSLGNTFEFNGTVIGAEQVVKIDPDRINNTGNAKSVLALGKPIFLRLNNDRTPTQAVTAERAFIYVREDTNPWDGPDAGAGEGASGETRFGSVVTIIAENYRGAADGVVFGSDDTYQDDFAVPPAIIDDPKFFTYAQLRTLRDHPERFDFIDEFRHRLALRTASVEFLNDVDADLREGDAAATLTTAEGDTITIAGARLSAGPALARRVMPTTPGAPIDITIERATGTTERISAARAVLNTAAPDELTRKQVETYLELQHVATTTRNAAEDIRLASATDQPVAGVRRQRTIAGITTDSPRYATLRTAPLDTVLDESRYLTQGANEFAGAIEAHTRLADMRTDISREIAANIHERIGMSLAGLVMVLTGAVVAIKLRDALTLTVYLWAFFPALVSVLIISMGKQLIAQFGLAAGAVPLYAGVALPAAYAAITYNHICRR
ncbi:MAG: LptF/LptG family permease [Planctomycetota bacterium]